MKNQKSVVSENSAPDISFIMPCFNEEAILEYTIPHLLEAFRKKGYQLELVAVDNGSWDRTGEIIRKLSTQHNNVVYHRVKKNQGYGFGILSGLSRCSGHWVGFIPADGQVDAEDVVRLFEAVLAGGEMVLGKVRRRFRMDGLKRKIISVGYNVFIRMLWWKLGSIDINGVPKILPRDVILAMDLKSKGWLLDPEIMIKAYYMGLRVMELNVFARMRGNGLSHVRMSTCLEFFRNLIVFRFSNEFLQWKKQYLHKTSNLEKKTTEASGVP